MKTFMDGYVAGNIAFNKTELNAYIEKISELLFEAGAKIRFHDTPLHIEIGNDIKQFIRTYSNEIDQEQGFISFSMDLSELLQKLICLIGVPGEINFHIRRVIYHFLSLSKTLENEKVISMAISIVKLPVNKNEPLSIN